ncbi:MAG: hypothetical protein EU521_01200 [Promethearchaeota archaeon]|nr:MAG: hypothetical protein EU521_01200 [Candidatus Lokiarchaeota archaeon]
MMTDGKREIILQPIGEIDEEIIKYLKKELKKIFSLPKLIFKTSEKPLPLKDSEYNKGRGQYNGSKIVNRLLNHQYEQEIFRVLGIMDEDLYSKNLNFIFGIATTSKNKLVNNFAVALISVRRLRETFYGKRKNKNLFRKRVLKEAIHELGHTFGLGHCNNYCIMRFSNHLGETDQKPLTFCDSCSKQIKTYIQRILKD